MIIKAGDQSQFLMNRLANCDNRFQNFSTHKRVVCVCSAGLLRSPTAAWVLSQDPWNYNTRAVGLTPEFALITLDRVLLEWADEFVCMSAEQQTQVYFQLKELKLDTPVRSLGIPDNFGYRDPELVRLIRERYEEITK